MKTFQQLIFGLMCLGLTLSDLGAQDQTGSSDGLTADLAAAQSRAEREGQGLLLFFTGSPKDPASQLLQERVLSNERFRMAVARNLVLLEIELTSDKDARPRLEGPLVDLVRDLGVNRLPSMHLVDARLRPFGRIDYRGQDAGACLREITNRLARLASRDRHFAVAARMGGEPKARELDLALIILGNDICVSRYRDVLETLFTLDRDGAYGIKRRYKMRVAWEGISADVPQLLHDGEWQQARDRVDAFIEEHEAAAVNIWKQRAYYWKATAIMQDEGLKSAATTLEKAKAAAPNSALGKRIARMLKSMEAPVEPFPEPDQHRRSR